ncbi:hypothetical protein PHYPSEUDO_001610 [Phytophthora pseudosyringae]|uniref:Uncharacterized protein n=1 Tax=Phytophthora pseudosyringae TaxID=221518 RepID=A0A8T1VYG9_9STRA|nr:hypothetical protein PHYPSEUDO_001610 [Phytophthora pseudosyringae]
MLLLVQGGMHWMRRRERERGNGDEEDDAEGEVGVEEVGSVPNVHLSFDDYRVIVSWMEVKGNFDANHGSGDKTKVGGKPKIKKLDAFKALVKHLQQYSTNITALLDRFERANSHDTIFWLGGQPSKQSAEAKATRSAKGPAVDNLSHLYEKSHKRYTAILENALDPYLINYFGHDTIPDLSSNI